MADEKPILSWEQADQIIKDQRAYIEQLRNAIRRLADQDATLSVQGGNVTVTLDDTLTDEEREEIEGLLWDANEIDRHLTEMKGESHQETVDNRKRAATLRNLLARLT